VVAAVPVWLPAAVWFPIVVPVALVAVALVAVALVAVALVAVALVAVALVAVALVAVALVAVALVAVKFCCAMAVSLPMTDNNPERNATAINIPAMDIADIALAVLLLLLLSGPLRRLINANEGI
jgi:hypothetical protein